MNATKQYYRIPIVFIMQRPHLAGLLPKAACYIIHFQLPFSQVHTIAHLPRARTRAHVLVKN